MVITGALVIACGGLGALARFAVDGLVQSRRLGEFPLGTFVVNIGGCFMLGLLDGLHPPHRAVLVLETALDRLLHHVLDVDARDPPARAGW